MSLCMKLKYALQINILLLMSITERNNKLLLPKHLKIFLLYANKTTLHLKRTRYSSLECLDMLKTHCINLRGI